jgi:hypothetical protein
VFGSGVGVGDSARSVGFLGSCMARPLKGVAVTPGVVAVLGRSGAY